MRKRNFRLALTSSAVRRVRSRSGRYSNLLQPIVEWLIGFLSNRRRYRYCKWWIIRRIYYAGQVVFTTFMNANI